MIIPVPTHPEETLTQLAGNGQYGSRELSKEVYAAGKELIRIPEVNKNYVKRIAITCGAGGESDIRGYHEQLFDARNAELEEQCSRLSHEVEAEVGGAEEHIKEVSAEMNKTSRYHEQATQGVPWTVFGRVQAVVLSVLSVLLLAVGINSNALVLMASGAPGFEHPLRAYLFTLLPVGAPLALKFLGSALESRRQRLACMTIVWAIGLVFSLIWAYLFAAVFPGLTQSASDIVRSFTDSTVAQAPRPSSNAIVFVGMVAEAFVAGGCWLSLQALFEKHQGAVRRPNKAYVQLQADLTFWRQRKSEYSRLTGILQGKVRAIAQARGHSVEDAVGYFRTAVKLAAGGDHLNDLLNR